MRLTLVVLGLLVLGLMAGPVLAAPPQTVYVQIDADGKIDTSEDTDLWIEAGEVMRWVCVGDTGAPDFKLRVTWSPALTSNTKPPWARNPSDFEGTNKFSKWKNCGASIVYGRMDAGAAWQVYKAKFEIQDNSGTTVSTWDPHWVIEP